MQQESSTSSSRLEEIEQSLAHQRLIKKTHAGTNKTGVHFESLKRAEMNIVRLLFEKFTLSNGSAASPATPLSMEFGR